MTCADKPSTPPIDGRSQSSRHVTKRPIFLAAFFLQFNKPTGRYNELRSSVVSGLKRNALGPCVSLGFFQLEKEEEKQKIVAALFFLLLSAAVIFDETGGRAASNVAATSCHQEGGGPQSGVSNRKETRCASSSGQIIPQQFLIDAASDTLFTFLNKK